MFSSVSGAGKGMRSWGRKGGDFFLGNRKRGGGVFRGGDAGGAHRGWEGVVGSPEGGGG